MRLRIPWRARQRMLRSLLLRSCCSEAAAPKPEALLVVVVDSPRLVTTSVIPVVAAGVPGVEPYPL